MGRIILVKLYVFCVLMVVKSKCLEFGNMNLPSRAPFALHPTEQFAMASSQYPLFLYTSSQNEFTHQNSQKNLALSSTATLYHQPRLQFVESSPHISIHQQHNKPVNVPHLTYGFQPKPVSNRFTNQHQEQQKKIHQGQHKNNQQNADPRQRHSERPIFQPSTKNEHQQSNKHYAENIQVQATVQQNRHNINSHSSSNVQNGQVPLKRPLKFHPQQQFETRERKKQHTTDRRPNRNNHNVRGTHGHEVIEKPANRNQNHHKDEHRQEILRPTFENTFQAFKSRNVHSHGSEYSLLPPHNLERPNFLNVKEHHQRNNNERLILQHGRGMRVENRPHLPQRPPFENGGIRINTAAGELPLLNIDSASKIDINPRTSNRNKKTLNHGPTDNQEKKTYILFKAPATSATESPAYVLENLPDTPSYVLNGLTETTVQLPGFFSTSEPYMLPEHVESPLVLDLVQIPDHSLFNNEEKHSPEPIQSPETRFSQNKEKNDFHHYNAEPTSRPIFQLNNHKESNSKQHYNQEPISNSNFKLTNQQEINFNQQYNQVSTSPPIFQRDDHKERNFKQHYNEEPVPNSSFKLTDHQEKNYNQESNSNFKQPDHKDRNFNQYYNQEPIQNSDFKLTDHKEKNKVQHYRQEPIQSTAFRSEDQEKNINVESYQPHPIASPEIVSNGNRQQKDNHYFYPTESYPTTSLRGFDDAFYLTSPIHAELPEETLKYQQKSISKPRIKEQKKPFNTSLHHPISYSSSVSVVSVRQSVDTKQPAPKKQKQTLKKALSAKKKVKIPEIDDYDNDYLGDEKNVPGEAGVDYPNYKDIPTTTFECRHFKSPGFYADLETSCQVFHNCDTSMIKHSFMCPNGTIFHQELLICDWWYNVKCDDSHEFYSLNSGIYTGANSNNDLTKKA